MRRRYIIWAGLCVLLAPLLVNLWVQYGSLAALQEASPLARTAALERRLAAVAADVQERYRVEALASLDVEPGVIAPEREDDDVERAFADASSDGVRRYFLCSLFTTRQVKVTLYDPAARRKIVAPEPAGWAAMAASTAFFSRIERGAVVDRDVLVVCEDDPSAPILVRPVTDTSSRIVAVAGLMLDGRHFREVLLPGVLPEALGRHFTGEELGTLAVGVYDDAGGLVTSTSSLGEGAADAQVPLGFAFPRWRLAAYALGTSHETLARRNFVWNISITILNTLVLIAGIAFALSAADREVTVSRMKTDFVANISHELKTPLASIRVLGEFLKAGRVSDPGQLRRYGEHIETESRRLGELIDTILNVSKLEAGHYHLSPAEADVAALVTETVAAFGPRLEREGFRVEVETPDPPLAPVRLDAPAIGQALSHLVDNAIKYSGQSRRILVSVTSGAGQVHIAVTDFGLGIPEQDLPKIFERFHRVGTGLVHDVKGSGLGLTLVRHIVEAHGGTATVASKAGLGSTFTISLPAETTPRRDPTRSAAPIGDRELRLGLEKTKGL